MVVFFAPWKKSQLQRPVRLVHKGRGNGDGGVVVREAELPQQADHQHLHLHLCKPGVEVETVLEYVMIRDTSFQRTSLARGQREV